MSNPKKTSDTVILEANGTSYECVGRTGKGSFGVVYKAVEVGTNRVVAIKRVLQDPKYKNRELQIMKMVAHRNTVQLIDSFYERYKGEVYLNLVLGYIPKNLYEVCSSYTKRNDRMPFSLIQVYTYQLCRSLAYVHSLGICHRDIKPQNLLIHPETNELRLCDFGSAKILIKGEPNVSYICSRYYRAPELIFGACDYTKAIDVWSAGCVMAELILGSPLFAGESGIDQLVEIIKVLGTPTREEIRAMNPDYKDYKQFPSIKPHPWQKLFPSDTPPNALELISKMLVYTPSSRVKPLEACTHPFFDDLRLHSQPNGIKLPLLFDFSPDELASAHKQALLEKLLPPEELVKLASQFDITLPVVDRTSAPPSTDGSSPLPTPDAPPPNSPDPPPVPPTVDQVPTLDPPSSTVPPSEVTLDSNPAPVPEQPPLTFVPEPVLDPQVPELAQTAPQEGTLDPPLGVGDSAPPPHHHPIQEPIPSHPPEPSGEPPALLEPLDLKKEK